ncbi:MAG: peptidase M61 [Rhodospirillaceae bacterium]|nr:peptidase M61 [Rhodospirillaceae bacterium]
MKRFASIAMIAAVAPCAALAQVPPQPLAMPAAIEAPRDAHYPGTITLAVDATDLNRHIFRVKEQIPVQGGAMTLLYPKWLPGNHSPTGRVDAVAGLIITANGKRVEWVRDPVDVFAFHVDVPAGAKTLDLEFQFLTSGTGDEGRVVMTPEMLNLQWNAVALYPAGHFTRQIDVAASVTLPKGWQFATALETASTSGDTTTFKTVPFETLVDSPMFAGKYFKRVDLGAIGGAPVRLDIVADAPELLEAKPEYIEAHKNLVTQAAKLFNSHHFDHYDLLLALSDKLGGIGLEHHRSSENGTVPTYFTEWDKNAPARNLLPHEFNHSWNGKFRRPADLWTPNYNVPMRGSLLWVYEGQTQYWGYVLGARAGLVTKEQTLDALAATAATYDYRIGREWKTLADTTNDPVVALRRAIPWVSYQRSEDYYSEGQLVWLDVDTLLRELSGGKKSLDDFAKAFHGIDDGSWVPVTYTFNDVARILNGIQRYDWAKLLRTRLESHGPGAPLDGITRGGYKLVYTDTPTAYFKDVEARGRNTNLSYSLGMVIGREGRLTDVRWGGPAHGAGLSLGAQIIAVNGVAYDADKLKTAIKNAKDSKDPITFLVKYRDNYTTVPIDYHDGLRYPRLERVEGTPDRLSEIFAAK